MLKEIKNNLKILGNTIKKLTIIAGNKSTKTTANIDLLKKIIKKKHTINLIKTIRKYNKTKGSQNHNEHIKKDTNKESTRNNQQQKTETNKYKNKEEINNKENITNEKKKPTKLRKNLCCISHNIRSWKQNHIALEQYMTNNDPPDIWMI